MYANSCAGKLDIFLQILQNRMREVNEIHVNENQHTLDNYAKFYLCISLQILQNKVRERGEKG